MSEMQYVCPNCGRDDALSIMVSTMANLTQHRDGTNNIETEADGDHEWDGTSPMVCRACGYSDSSWRFENPTYVGEQP